MIFLWLIHGHQFLFCLLKHLDLEYIYYIPASKKRVVYWLSSGRLSVRRSVRRSVCNRYVPSHFPQQPCILAASNLVLVLQLGILQSSRLPNSCLPVIYFLSAASHLLPVCCQSSTSYFMTSYIFHLSVCNKYFPVHFSQQTCIMATSNLVWRLR